MAQPLKVVKGFMLAYPNAIEENYLKNLQKLISKLKSVTVSLLVKSESFISSYNKSIRQDDIVDDFDIATKAIKAAVTKQLLRLVNLLPNIFNNVRVFSKLNIERSILHMGVSSKTQLVSGSNVIKTPDISILRKMWVFENTKLIKSIPTEMLSKVGEAVNTAVNTGESATSLANNITDIVGITKRRAKLIARDQISKLRAALNRYESLKHGIIHYEWSTVKDDAVRASHEAMQGKICSWVDPTIYKNSMSDTRWKKRTSINGVEKNPGEDILCRCTNILATNIEGTI